MKTDSKLVAALAAIVLNPKIRAFLEANDPKALTQAEEALRETKAAEDLRTLLRGQNYGARLKEMSQEDLQQVGEQMTLLIDAVLGPES